MKKFFARENFVFNGLDPKARIQSIGVTVLVAIAFGFAAYCFVNMLYAFSDILGSIVCASVDVALKDFLRTLPLFLTFFMAMWLLIYAHALFRYASPEKLHKSHLKNSIALIVFAAVNIIYVVVSRIVGAYVSLIEGNPSPIYPLDTVLFSFFVLAVGILGLLYALKMKDKFEFVAPSRGPIVRKARFVYCLFVALWSLIALFSCATFTYGLFIIDFLHGYLFYSLAFLLVLLNNTCFIAFWEFYYNQLTPEKKKELLFPLAICGLIVSVFFTALYFIALGTNLDGPSNVGFGVLPVAFAASVNIATLLVVFTPVIVSVVVLIKGILARKA